MDDLIFRAAAIDALKRAAYWQDGERKITELPAVDAVPVKHGRWYDKGSLSCRCSCCGCKSNKEYDYCPNCGAKMGKTDV